MSSRSVAVHPSGSFSPAAKIWLAHQSGGTISVQNSGRDSYQAGSKTAVQQANCKLQAKKWLTGGAKELLNLGGQKPW
ncbi:hypothetical protein D0A61_22780 (plasmid) [Pantoea agglomerans]|nr:hypothetical protein D0A61_22780 [Pantoea agglomerans]